MTRARKFDLERQTHFAKTHSKVMTGHYMSDLDSIQIVNTENQLYNQYTYKNNTPIVRRIIEVKSRMSKALQYMFEGKTPPTEQVKSQAYFVAELNAFRRQESNFDRPQCDYWFIVEDHGEYPYDIWSVSTTFGTGEIQFKQIGEVMNDEQYKAFFSTSASV